MNAREELLRAVQRGMSDVSNWPDDVGYKLLGVNMSKPQNAVVDAVLAAGYRKPQPPLHDEWGVAWSTTDDTGTMRCETKAAAHRLVDKLRKVGWKADLVTRPTLPWEPTP